MSFRGCAPRRSRRGLTQIGIILSLSIAALVLGSAAAVYNGAMAEIEADRQSRRSATAVRMVLDLAEMSNQTTNFSYGTLDTMPAGQRRMVCPKPPQAARRIMQLAPDDDGDGLPDDIFGNPMRTFIHCEDGPIYAGDVPSLRVAVLVVTERPAGDEPHYTTPPGGWLASRTEKIGVGLLMPDAGDVIRPVSRAGSQTIVDFIAGLGDPAFAAGDFEGEIVAASARLIEGTAPPRRMVPPPGYGIARYPKDFTEGLPTACGTEWPYGLKPGCYNVRHDAEAEIVARACPAGQTGRVEVLRDRSRRIRVYEDERPDFPHEEWAAWVDGEEVSRSCRAPPPPPPSGGNGGSCRGGNDDNGYFTGTWHTVQHGEHSGERYCSSGRRGGGNRGSDFDGGTQGIGDSGTEGGGIGAGNGQSDSDGDSGGGADNDSGGGSDSGGGPF